MKLFILFTSICVVLGCYPQKILAESLYNKIKKGNTFFLQEKYDEALNTYTDAQVEHPEDPKLKYNIASAKYKMKNYEDALKAYLDVAATVQDAQLEEKSLFNIGNTLYRQGKLEESVAYYKKALDLDPNDKDALQNIEFVREEIKRKINEAKDTAQKQQDQKKEDKQQTGEKNDQQKKEQASADQNKENKGQDNQTQSAGEQQPQHNDQQNKENAAGQDQNKKEEQKNQQQTAAAGKEKGTDGEQQEGSPSQTREMTREEADQWLNSVQENRDKIKEGKQKIKNQGTYRSGKDW
jgi:Ca-activated chloride channel homolog